MNKYPVIRMLGVATSFGKPWSASLERIRQSVAIYEAIIRDWCGV